MEFEFTREEMKQAAPALAEYNQNVLWDDMWERPGLSKRDRSPHHARICDLRWPPGPD